MIESAKWLALIAAIVAGGAYAIHTTTEDATSKALADQKQEFRWCMGKIIFSGEGVTKTGIMECAD